MRRPSSARAHAIRDATRPSDAPPSTSRPSWAARIPKTYGFAAAAASASPPASRRARGLRQIGGGPKPKRQQVGAAGNLVRGCKDGQRLLDEQDGAPRVTARERRLRKVAKRPGPDLRLDRRSNLAHAWATVS